MNSDWHPRIEQRLRDLGLTMKDASIQAGLNPTFVRDLLRRNRSPNAQAVIDLAKVLRVTPGWLLTGEGDTGEIDVPLLSGISAGTFTAQEGVRAADIRRYIKVAGLPDGNWFALQVDGTSMDRIAPDGSIIIVNREDDRLIDGKHYVFALDDGAATFKRYRNDPEPMLTPYSWHPDHYAVPVGDRELYVFGRVRRVITEL